METKENKTEKAKSVETEASWQLKKSVRVAQNFYKKYKFSLRLIIHIM